MNTTGYTPYHPRWYRRRMSVWWWLERWSYAKFVLRELTSVFVALCSFATLWLIVELSRSPEAWSRAMAVLRSPLAVLLSIITLVALLYHSLTWFSLAPSAMVVRTGGRRLPDAMVSGAHYAAWIVISAVLALIIWRAR
jgi:fumarate reductase subunit C